MLKPALKSDLIDIPRSRAAATQRAAAWRVLVIDNDPDVHAAARMALEGRTLFDRPLVFMHAYSGDEARSLVLRENDLAMVILDVVTEDAQSGLDLVSFIRHTAGLRNTRIVLRTGKSGHVPALSTLLQHDINDYRTKAELTCDRLLAMVVTAVRSYKQLCAVEENRRGLELIVRSSALLLEQTDLRAFSDGVITQLSALLNVSEQGIVCTQDDQRTDRYPVIAAKGRFESLLDFPLHTLADTRVLKLIQSTLAGRCNSYGNSGGLALYLGSRDGSGLAVFVDVPHFHTSLDRQLIEAFCANLDTLLHNRALLERLHSDAYYDPLVRLPNRASFIEKVDECAQRTSLNHILALFDIDDFSAANDVMGHRFGDRLLEAVARRLDDCLPANAFLARVGSDTFGVLGTITQVSPLTLLESVRHPVTIDGIPHKVSLTCGYVLLHGNAQQSADLVKDATIALKRAKRDHRGQHLQYSEAMGTEARARALMLSELREAVEKEQLFLVYQPQLNLMTKQLVGLEALLRWRRGDDTLVSPEQFIPVAEHSGLIVPLGHWVLRTACQTMRELIDRGQPPLRMAVNVSPVQLKDPGFFESVRTTLEEYRLEGRHLELEITESVAALPTQLLDSTLTALRRLGASIAIDDFGTGYSSLSYLERLPLDRIKIDRTFVRQLGEPRGARIAEVVTQLGKKLGLNVLAEGIEDSSVWDALISLGCQEGQGYYIAAPMEKEMILTWRIPDNVCT